MTNSPQYEINFTSLYYYLFKISNIVLNLYFSTVVLFYMICFAPFLDLIWISIDVKEN